MRQVICLTILVGFIGSNLFAQQSDSQADPSSGLSLQSVQDNLEGDFRAEDISAANSWAQSLQLADWLGPLAPVALSPFFGMACLSGLALYGPDWVTNNALLGASGPLQNEWLFVVFIILTLLTSLPRLSKVSKPFAQAMDQLETYSVIIILLAIKVLADVGAGADQTTEIAMVQLGVFSVAADTLLMIAMAINIIVVNTVKFFFEFLVWLTPIPALDAIFEVCNKTVCAALMAVYAFSPTIATIINVVILLCALVVFRWVSRQVRYYRTMVMDPVVAKLWSNYGACPGGSIVVFPKDACGPFAAKSRLRICRDGDSWTLNEANWWMPSSNHTIAGSTTPPTLRRGWVMHTITFYDGDQKQDFKVSRRYDASLGEIAVLLGIEMPSETSTERQDAKVEFA
ncbi:hypothetical protein [Planctomycetes bacterium K23_9]|uniref:Uncharacterized protein n=1 Tax=Stieleria marina TaxID=1930275 RepID=A0A517NQ25_9BACT|nr:hypothetical protein K239x_11660 [Planctomycetes bacterium K23_9]